MTVSALTDAGASVVEDGTHLFEGISFGKQIYCSTPQMYIDNDISVIISIGECMSQAEGIVPKRLMLAQISICDGCCCGKTEKGHPEGRPHTITLMAMLRRIA
jgi:hypothetical protein